MSYTISKLTPNLIVADVVRSLAFYRDVLGFEVQITVPDAGPFVFAAVTHGNVEVFLNARDAAVAEYPAFSGRPLGGTLTLFMEVTGVEAAHQRLNTQVQIVMPLEKKWYGSTEFAFLDPDGYVITFAERSGPAE
jgi:uncharacterized glyoxalase superfamily protein PhnB